MYNILLCILAIYTKCVTRFNPFNSQYTGDRRDLKWFKLVSECKGLSSPCIPLFHSERIGSTVYIDRKV